MTVRVLQPLTRSDNTSKYHEFFPMHSKSTQHQADYQSKLRIHFKMEFNRVNPTISKF